ncbi:MULTISPECIES: cellulose biosynthesis protein BcsG [Dyella]|uniref:Cellulose biosynthesis protein BcsG n=2 Tax=Dyella TaxID=231454 RepID=A0A4R0Z1K6_9GAMM|nr:MULTISPECIES: cellulose biosynthesis protein BcsG [Dyella]TBR39356.1 cellulose biosynthesis protein BcsG [Dyella terrae]TCI13056.1 cellulose biosynthesis protein BcsG [Dyella soli]
MGLWNLYFIAVLYLGLAGAIQPIWWANLLFALALLVPLHQRWQRIARQVLAVIAGAALLYRESSLPPVGYALRQASQLSGFSGTYMMELARRVFDPAMVYIPLLVLLAYAIVNRWVRVTTFVLIGLIVVPLWQGMSSMIAMASSGQATSSNPIANAGLANAGAVDGSGSYDEQLATFHHNEKSRHVIFSPGSNDPASQFDIIFIHICSLSWDDMDVANMRENPLFARFDYLFTHFSSAASYSGPAAIRVLRASCGQDAHKELYSAAPDECHVFADLAAAGYDVQFLMNHDGRFDDFRGVVEREIGVPGIQPQSNEGLPMAMREFDGSPLIGDYDALAKWYQGRVARGGSPVALYYNTVTLHDGNRLPGNNLTSVQSYPIRLKMLLGDVDRLIDLISRSGRKAVLVFVPEHGAALRGDAGQISGLREIPTPRIIDVPVGVKLVGLPADKDHHGQPIAIDAPTSYLALTQMISNMLATSPFRADAPALQQYAADLPQTRMVGENENTVTMKTANGYVIHTPDGVWMEGK